MSTTIPCSRLSLSQRELEPASWRSGKYSNARVAAAKADVKRAEADEATAKARTYEDLEKLRQDIILDMRRELESQRRRVIGFSRACRYREKVVDKKTLDK